MFKLQKRAIRIISLSKFNAHTDPLFKKLKLLKVFDLLTLQVLKTYSKFKHNKLPAYLQNGALIRNNVIHSHNTRRATARHRFRNNRMFANLCLRHHIVQVVNITSPSILDKIDIHSMPCFVNFVKHPLLQAYQVRCTLLNCRLCK